MLRRPTNRRSGGEGTNEERIGDDLWGACRCRRNNIIVNFAIAALLKCAGRWVHRANARIMGVARVYLRLSSSAGESYIFASRHPDTRRVEGRDATPKMRKE